MDAIEKAAMLIKEKEIKIGRHKYNQLKTKLAKDGILSPDDLLKIEAFEKTQKKSMSKNQAEKIIEYTKKVSQPAPKKEYEFKPVELSNTFLKTFSLIYKGHKGDPLKFVKNIETKNNILPLIYYFTKDARFFNCKNVVDHEFNYSGKIKQSIPSFEKGLLIIGNFGNGKSSSMNVFHRIFSRLDNLKFRQYSANDVIESYENCATPDEKRSFWFQHNKGVIYYDDVRTERIASNYGKTNLFKDIIEKREVRNLKTYITCNFKTGSPGDVKEALIEFAEKYENRVFDRLFSMFNIIIFTGGSFRK